MTYIIFGMIVLLIALGITAWYARENENTFAIFLTIILSTLTVLSVFTWSWVAAGYKANIINREYNTNYTQEEVFYAKEVIETIKNLERNGYEINGNLNIGEKK
jgi:hypothetical protein